MCAVGIVGRNEWPHMATKLLSSLSGLLAWSGRGDILQCLSGERKLLEQSICPSCHGKAERSASTLCNAYWHSLRNLGGKACTKTKHVLVSLVSINVQQICSNISRLAADSGSALELRAFEFHRPSVKKGASWMRRESHELTSSVKDSNDSATIAQGYTILNNRNDLVVFSYMLMFLYVPIFSYILHPFRWLIESFH